MNKVHTPKDSIASYILMFSLGMMPALATLKSNPVLAQATTSDPAATPLRIDGSSSMKVTNEIRQQQSPTANIQTRYNGADAALKSVLDDNADLAAVGRPLIQPQLKQPFRQPFDRLKMTVQDGCGCYYFRS